MSKIIESLTGKPAQPQPLMLRNEITWTKSVLHACIQQSSRDINAALGVSDDKLLDEYLTTAAGKQWLQGFREYAIYVLGKSL